MSHVNEKLEKCGFHPDSPLFQDGNKFFCWMCGEYTDDAKYGPAENLNIPLLEDSDKEECVTPISATIAVHKVSKVVAPVLQKTTKTTVPSDAYAEVFRNRKLQGDEDSAEYFDDVTALKRVGGVKYPITVETRIRALNIYHTYRRKQKNVANHILTAVSLFIALEESGLHRGYKEVAEMFGLKKKNILGRYRKTVQSMKTDGMWIIKNK